MEWNDYLKQLLSEQTCFDTFSFSHNFSNYSISPIVKASILMLDKMSEHQGENSIFVFPETHRAFYDFVLAKTLFDITTGKIRMEYNPQSFVRGQKLGYRGCVVVFEEYEKMDGYDRIKISFKDKNQTDAIPLRLCPVFQTVNSKKVSTSKAYYKAVEDLWSKRKKGEKQQLTKKEIEDNRTHLSGSIVVVTEIKKTVDYFRNTMIDNNELSKYLFIAHMNGDGDISNLTAGQLEGNPAIIIASDMYSVVNALKKNRSIAHIIFDASSLNAENQMDAFDDVLKKKIPVTCVTDLANSFAHGELRQRKFNEWVWDSKCISECLYSNAILDTVNRRVRNCAVTDIEYRNVSDTDISDAISLLYKNKTAAEEQRPAVIKCYEKLFELSIGALRRIVPYSESEKGRTAEFLAECIDTLDKEKKFIAGELYEDMVKIEKTIENVVINNGSPQKIQEISRILMENRFKSVCFVVSVRQEKETIHQYWEHWFSDHFRQVNLHVMYPEEYAGNSTQFFDLTIISGWLGNRPMRSCFFQYNYETLITLLYPYEEKWKKGHTRAWKRNFESSGNRQIVHQSLNNNKTKLNISFDRPEEEAPVNPDIPESRSDELADIEELIRTSRYRQYSSKYSKESVEAYPVGYAGGLIAFYRPGHKVTVATDIIHETSSQISQKYPEELKIGDFVVVRESEKDIIREIADKLLEKEGKQEFRKLAGKWREAIQVELLFSDESEIIRRIWDAGCTKDYATIRNWIFNEEMIIPKQKEDLEYIAQATDDEVLAEQIDKVYFAGREVRKAHIQAGKDLSVKLRTIIADELKKLDEIDPFNIWDPISIYLDDIGTAKVLKIIDIGEITTIDSTNTNRLLSE